MIVTFGPSGCGVPIGWRKGPRRHPGSIPRGAEDLVAADLAAIKVGLQSRVAHAPITLDLEQRQAIFGWQVFHIAKLFGQQQSAAVGVQDLGPPVGSLHGFTKTHRAVVGEYNDVGSIDEGQDGIGKLLGSWSSVGRQGHVAEEDFNFR